ncbi:Uncharacterised protein [Vibrio cholerae]|nr:Uncharacterised protein [Vibrio cholerae]
MSSFAFASHLFFNRFHSGDQLVTAFRNRWTLRGSKVNFSARMNLVPI